MPTLLLSAFTLLSNFSAAPTPLDVLVDQHNATTLVMAKLRSTKPPAQLPPVALDVDPWAEEARGVLTEEDPLEAEPRKLALNTENPWR